MIARRRSLIVLTWVALAALALSSTPAAGGSISPQPLAEITIAANGGHPTNSAAGQVTPDSVTIEVPIAAGSDDAGVNAAWDWCFYGANHNEIYFGQCADGADITSGFRFNPVAIPRGAHIVDAHIRFTVDGPYTGAAGDVNGDGYADLAVGAYNYDTTQWDDGRAYVYYGNQGGLSLRPQQRRSDNSAPIAYLGKSDQPDRLRLALLGRTPFGRGKVKLEWEVKPRSVLFDGTGRQRTAVWVDTGTAGALLDELVDGLQQDTLYHWRVRLLYHPATTPFQQTSRWLTNPWNGWNEARLRTAGPPTAVKLTTLEATPGPPSYLPGGGVVALLGLFLGAALFLARRRCSVILQHQCSDTLDIVAPEQSHMRVSPPGGGQTVLRRTVCHGPNFAVSLAGLELRPSHGKASRRKEECLLQENSSHALLSRSTVMLTTS